MSRSVLVLKGSTAHCSTHSRPAVQRQCITLVPKLARIICIGALELPEVQELK